MSSVYGLDVAGPSPSPLIRRWLIVLALFWSKLGARTQIAQSELAPVRAPNNTDKGLSSTSAAAGTNTRWDPASVRRCLFVE